MSRLLLVLAIALGSLLLTGCNPEARGFALPPGSTEAGQSAFLELGCNACHSVKGTIERLENADQPIHIVLGGETTYVKTYGDLVTSIIHPSHKLSSNRSDAIGDDGGSAMPNFNDAMTVQQMIDLTAMLQDSYSLIPPNYTYYYTP